jgi:hypothetical protein
VHQVEGETVMDEPLAPLREAAVALHELFRAYQEAGFTESQALALCVGALTGILNRPKTEEDKL